MKSQFILCAIAIAFLSSPAIGKARDDVLSGAARCSTAIDDHTWLNCYYGAAQPIRAQLGLPAAPESQTSLVPPASDSQMTSSSGQKAMKETGTRENILSRAARCYSIIDEHTWLNCYYGAAQPMRAQLGLPAAPESQTLLVPSAGSSRVMEPQTPYAQAGGGVISELFGGTVILSRVPATAYSFDHYGIFRITLSDGSVWQQNGSDNSFAQWRGPANRYLVSITTGSLGSYNLQVAGDNKSYKVQRLS